MKRALRTLFAASLGLFVAAGFLPQDAEAGKGNIELNVRNKHSKSILVYHVKLHVKKHGQKSFSVKVKGNKNVTIKKNKAKKWSEKVDGTRYHYKFSIRYLCGKRVYNWTSKVAQDKSDADANMYVRIQSCGNLTCSHDGKGGSCK